MQSRYLGKQRLLTVLVFGESPSLVIEGPLKECLYLERVIFLKEWEDDALTLLVAHDKWDILVIGKHCFHFAVGFKKGDVLVHRIQNLHEVFIIAFFILFIAFLKGDDDKIVIFELLDYLHIE